MAGAVKGASRGWSGPSPAAMVRGAFRWADGVAGAAAGWVMKGRREGCRALHASAVEDR